MISSRAIDRVAKGGGAIHTQWSLCPIESWDCKLPTLLNGARRGDEALATARVGILNFLDCTKNLIIFISLTGTWEHFI